MNKEQKRQKTLDSMPDSFTVSDKNTGKEITFTKKTYQKVQSPRHVAKEDSPKGKFLAGLLKEEDSLMKTLIYENRINNQALLDSGINLLIQDLASIGYLLELQVKKTDKSFNTINDTTDAGHVTLVDPAEIGKMAGLDTGFDIWMLLYNAGLSTNPRATNPAEHGDLIQMSEEWYGGNLRTLVDYILHEISHREHFKAGVKDLTHLNNNRNIDPALYDLLKVGQMQPQDYYLMLLLRLKPYWSKNMTTPTQPTYKYFKPSEIVNLKPELVQMLDKARELAGTPFIINNGFRTPEQNKTIEGAAPNSPHMRGLAVDLACNNTTRTKILKGLLNCGIPVFIEVAGRHVHVDIDGAVHPLGDTMWGNDPS